MLPTWIDNLRQRIERVPMLKALAPFVVAILLADYITLPLWSVVVGFLVCVVMAALLRHNSYANIYTIAALMLAGFMAVGLQREQRPEPPVSAIVEIEVGRLTAEREHYTSSEARLIAFTSKGKSYRTRGEIRLTADSSLHIASGERLLCNARIRPFDMQQSYGRYMAARGFQGQMRLREEDIISRSAARPRFGSRLQLLASERIGQLQLNDKCEAVVRAMAIGDKSHITPQLRRAYTRGGAAHLLAVSGLHIGFIYVVANLLLAWLSLLRHGQVVRAVAVISLIWIYAAMAGFTPSIVRAASMFTLLQLALHTASRTDALNTLCLTAFIMLLLDSSMLHDAGFQLSMLAVAAIIEFAVPIHNLLKAKAGAVGGWVVSALAASTAATIATAPLTLYLFGQASLWSIPSGIVMINLAAVVVGSAMVWVIAPIPLLQGLFSWVIATSTQMMNAITEWCDATGIITAELHLDGRLCVAAYMILALITLIVWGVRGRN